jgi:TM2 domain-containing membrane protein YozV
MRIWLLLIILSVTAQATAQKRFFPATRLGGLLFEQTGEREFSYRFAHPDTAAKSKENPRLVAALLDISLGLFGVHRLYLGTDVKVPVFYTLTIGGGGVLWLADLGLILFTRDLSPYFDNSNVFMWVPDRGQDKIP